MRSRIGQAGCADNQRKIEGSSWNERESNGSGICLHLGRRAVTSEEQGGHEAQVHVDSLRDALDGDFHRRDPTSTQSLIMIPDQLPNARFAYRRLHIVKAIRERSQALAQFGDRRQPVVIVWNRLRSRTAILTVITGLEGVVKERLHPRLFELIDEAAELRHLEGGRESRMEMM